jgi:hypothetical protein
MKYSGADAAKTIFRLAGDCRRSRNVYRRSRRIR